MHRTAIYDARNNFSALVKIAEGGKPVELTRHDKPVAVIISYDDWVSTKPKNSFMDWYFKFREENKEMFEDPTWEGLVIPKDEYLDEEYEKRIAKIWGEN